jgi:NAD(P)H-hydrate epimerase
VALVVDALIGYGLTEAPRDRAADLIERTADADRVCSLDVPSGVNATTGETPGVAADPDRVLTLALPKTGLTTVDGDLLLGDIGIPVGVYRRLGMDFETPFRDAGRVPLHRR